MSVHLCKKPISISRQVKEQKLRQTLKKNLIPSNCNGWIYYLNVISRQKWYLEKGLKKFITL